MFVKRSQWIYYSEKEANNFLQSYKLNETDTLIYVNDQIFKSPGSTSYIFIRKKGVDYFKFFYNNDLHKRIKEGKLIKLSNSNEVMLNYYRENKKVLSESSLKYIDYGDHPAFASVKIITGNHDTLFYQLTIREYLSDSSNVRCVFLKNISEMAKSNIRKKNIKFRTYWKFD